MKRNANSSISLPIGQVFNWSWMLVRKHIWFWVILSFVLHFVSWRFVIETWEYLQNFIDEEYLQIFTPEILKFAKEFVKWLVIALGYFTLVQVIISQLIYDQLLCCQKKIRIGDIVKRFKTTDFLFDVLRTIGIMGIYYAIIFAWCIVYSLIIAFFLLVAVYLEAPENYPAVTLISGLVIYLVFLFCFLCSMSRLSLAVPVTVVENKKMLMSIKRSWRMTAACWIRMSLVVVLTSVICAVLLLVPLLAYVALCGTDFSGLFPTTVLWSYIVFQPSLSAIVMGSCYCYLRSTEDKQNRPPEFKASE